MSNLRIIYCDRKRKKNKILLVLYLRTKVQKKGSVRNLNKMLTNGFSFDNEDALSENTQLVI